MKTDFECYRGKRVLVTGHTGFKGSWLCEWLIALGAKVYGFSNGIPTKPSLYHQLTLTKRIALDMRGDIRNRTAVQTALERACPDFIFHLAAQPLVRLSYEYPVATFETNIMGTVNVLDAVRHWLATSVTGLVRTRRTNFRSLPRVSVVLVTTDKCYENRETTRPYREDDPMGGFDPYSCSKGCDELVISSYRRSYFNRPESLAWIASARAGNVVGGGDWAQDRIVPDVIRALRKGEPVPVRNKVATRPWQHVLEPLSGYLALGAALRARKDFEDVSGGFNFGPDPDDNRTVKDVVEELLKHAPGTWIDKSDPKAVHEAGLLNLDIQKAARVLGWKPRWNFEETIARVAEWYFGVQGGATPRDITQKQINDFMGTEA